MFWIMSNTYQTTVTASISNHSILKSSLFFAFYASTNLDEIIGKTWKEFEEFVPTIKMTTEKHKRLLILFYDNIILTHV